MPDEIIGLLGPAGGGKSHGAEWFRQEHKFTLVKMATPLKNMLRGLGLTHEHIEGKLKEEPCAILSGKSPRFAMQTLGTEWGRQIMDQDFWVNAWKETSRDFPRVVVDDVRFANEAQAIRDMGGTLIRVRPAVDKQPQMDNATHASETESNAIPVDFEIPNDYGPDFVFLLDDVLEKYRARKLKVEVE